MGYGMAHAKLCGRYRTRAEAYAALEAIEAEEESYNKPWCGWRGDYEIRRYHGGDYMAPQNYDNFGVVEGFIEWELPPE
jgi:hypothetical protein